MNSRCAHLRNPRNLRLTTFLGCGAAALSLLWLVLLSHAQDLPDFPVPNWPEDGVIPAALKNHYVFVDLNKNEYVVAYPVNLGTPAFEKDGPGAIKTARYELLRNVDPMVTVEVTHPSPAKYRYTYSVTNGPASKQSIDQWSMVVPLQAGNDAIKHPEGWFGIVQRGRTFKLRNPEWIRNGAAAVWSFEKGREVIQPGATKKGFELESDLRPGFTVGYFRKAESVESTVATSGNVPKQVKDDLDLLLTVEYNSKTLPLIGPKFDKAVDDRTVALDFVEGINLLARRGTLDPNSEFVKTTLTELKAVAPATRGASITITSQDKTPAETEVFNALKAGLRVN